MAPVRIVATFQTYNTNTQKFEKLDEIDPIETPYILEVSSCGLERHLRSAKHFEAAIGESVELKFFKSFLILVSK